MVGAGSLPTNNSLPVGLAGSVSNMLASSLLPSKGLGDGGLPNGWPNKSSKNKESWTCVCVCV